MWYGVGGFALLLVAAIALFAIIAVISIGDGAMRWIDQASHGVRYTKTVSFIGQALTGILTQEKLAETVVQQLPKLLSVCHAAFWVTTGDGYLQLAGHSILGKNIGLRDKKVVEFLAGQAGVEVFSIPFRVASDPTDWNTVMRLRSNNQLLGLVLLGKKVNGLPYAEDDLQTLRTLAHWITALAANLRHLHIQQITVERERQLLMSLAQTEERLLEEIAGELHDRGISALAMIRMMVEQEQPQPIVLASVERVIADLRSISSRWLSPSGLSQGLREALESMAEMQVSLGHPVNLEIAGAFESELTLSGLVSREMFYIAQEAVVNAVKHASATQITVQLSLTENAILLVVRDNGQGFDFQAVQYGAQARGTGIMLARARRIGGLITTKSEIDRGTEVRLEVPLKIALQEANTQSEFEMGGASC
jgi:signal transduction histidine kinase